MQTDRVLINSKVQWWAILKYRLNRFISRKFYKNNPKKSLECLLECYNIMNEYTSSDLMAKKSLLYDMGHALRKNNQLNEAIKCLETSKDICEELHQQESDNYIDVLNELGNVEWARNDFPKALSYYNESLKYCKRFHSGSSRLKARAYHNIGIILKERDENKQAIEQINKARRIYQRLGKDGEEDLATANLNLAQTLIKIKDYKYAEQLCNEAIEIYESMTRSNETEQIAFALLCLANCQRESWSEYEELEKVIKLYEQSFNIYEEIYGTEYNVRCEHVLRNLAECRIKMGQKDGAGIVLQRCIQIFHAIEEKNKCDLTDEINLVKNRIIEITSKNGDS